MSQTDSWANKLPDLPKITTPLHPITLTTPSPQHQEKHLCPGGHGRHAVTRQPFLGHQICLNTPTHVHPYHQTILLPWS